MAFAMNVIGKYVVPSDWINNPVTAGCTMKKRFDPQSDPIPANPSQSYEEVLVPVEVAAEKISSGSRAFCDELPTLSPCTSNFCKQTACDATGGGQQNFRLIVQLDTPISGINQVQIAVNTGDQWAASHPMVDCTPEKYVNVYLVKYST